MSLSDITDLGLVLNELKLFDKHNWQTFGHNAGLHDNTLKAITAVKPEDIEACFNECVASWLKRQDNVNDKGKPTLLRLADIVEKTGDKFIAEKIRRKSMKHETTLTQSESESKREQSE